MKIVEQTRDNLVIVVIPWFVIGGSLSVGLALIGTNAIADLEEDPWGTAPWIALGLGLIWYAWFVGWFRIHFDRLGGQVTWAIYRPFDSSHHSLPLETILGVVNDLDHEGSVRFAFETRDDTVPIRAEFTNTHRARFKNVVDDWLDPGNTPN